MSSKIVRRKFSDGTTIARITLYQPKNAWRNECWVGDVILEYGQKANGSTWGRYYSITDFGNYSYAWFSIGTEPFEHFVWKMAKNDQEYFIGKLTMGHDEQHVFLLKDSKELALESLEEAFEDGDITQAERDNYKELLDGVESAEELNQWYGECLECNEGYESFVYGYAPRCQGYMRNVFPLLAEVLEGNGAND